MHFVDSDNRLDLSDIAIIIIMVKIAMAPVLDFPSVITLATVLINKMHKRQQENISDSDMLKAREKVLPVIDKIKEVLK